MYVYSYWPPDKEEEAKAAGADYVGLDEYIEKIRTGLDRH
jgi:large subunit ribosomal protein L1